MPEDMTHWDYLLSCARNLREERQILRNKEEYEYSRKHRTAHLPNLKKYSLSKLIIINHTSTFSGFWRMFDVLSCLLSSYVYCWHIAFTEKHRNIPIFEYFIESIFFITMITKFLTDFIPDGETEPTKDLMLISKNYLKNGFVMDLIPLIPFNFFASNKGSLRLAYGIKLVRIISGIKLFNVRALNNIIKN